MSSGSDEVSRGGAGPVGVSGPGPCGEDGAGARSCADLSSVACPSTPDCVGGLPPRDELGEERARPVGRVGQRTSRVARVNTASQEVLDEDDPLLSFAPYEHVAPRRNSINAARQRAFVAALAASGIVTQAARVVGVSLEALYKLRHKPGAEAFAKAWDQALDRGMMRLEDCALERAIQGEERPIVSLGQVVTTWTRYDTALILFLLRQRRSARYGGKAEIARETAREQREYNREAVLDSINAKIEKMRFRRLGIEDDEEARRADEAAREAAYRGGR